MKRTETARYARWAMRAAIALALVIVGVYTVRQWQAMRARRASPPPVPQAVQKRSAEFSYSKVEGNRTLFTVRASRTTEFKQDNLALLEDVWITIYGIAGKRFDNIHARQCEYLQKTGLIQCKGEVQFELESAEEAKLRPGERRIFLGASDVAFNRETGEARSEKPVTIRFPYGEGKGTGISYSTREAVVNIGGQVALTLTNVGRRSGAPPVNISGGQLEIRRDQRALHLHGPVEMRQEAQNLTAGRFTLEMDERLRARRAVADGSPQLTIAEGPARLNLTAGQISTLFRPDGSAESMQAKGNVRGRFEGRGSAEDELRAAELNMALDATGSTPVEMSASGAVQFTAQRADGARTLESQQVRVKMAPPPASSGQGGATAGAARIARVESPVPATLTLRTAAETLRVAAGRMSAAFDPSRGIGVAKSLEGNDGAAIVRRVSGKPEQNTSSQSFTLALDASGAWTEIEQTGNFRYREADRTAQAGSGRMVRAAETLTLSGNAAVADAQGRTTANSIVIATGGAGGANVRATGNVLTSYFAAERNGVTNLAAQPAHIRADALEFRRDSGRALYTGRVRLWQGDAVIEAGTMELLQREQRLEARDGVQALVPEGAGGTNGSDASTQDRASSGKGPAAIWRVRAARLAYLASEGRARLEDNVRAESTNGQMASRVLELFLTPAGNSNRQLARAVATGGVSVRMRQGKDERRGSGERGEYVSAEGRFVLSGGNATLFDTFLGTTTGRQLTFFLADDRILVDSEEGTRTLSRHRVQP